MKNYLNVATLSELQKMLGGIGESTARKIIRSNQIRRFYIHGTYFIPKTCVIDYNPESRLRNIQTPAEGTGVIIYISSKASHSYLRTAGSFIKTYKYL